ncbi:MAG: hypothetical protein IJZ32_03665 [Clostridia bacterium]|nr:hypothetical protein [Clostridia bacterium]
MNKRQRKREEERKILAEMDEAMKAGVKNAETVSKKADNAEKTSESSPVIHCKRCKTVMEKGVCPTCGFRIYVPMDEQKRKKIRWIVTGVCLIAFVIVYFACIK